MHIEEIEVGDHVRIITSEEYEKEFETSLPEACALVDYQDLVCEVVARSSYGGNTWYLKGPEGVVSRFDNDPLETYCWSGLYLRPVDKVESVDQQEFENLLFG